MIDLGETSPVKSTEAEPLIAIYSSTALNAEIRQGEIISNIVENQFDETLDDFVGIKRDFVIVAAQDCDLLHDYNRLAAGNEPQLLGILLYEAKDAAVAKNATTGGKEIWKPISQNKNERFQLLEQVDSAFDLLGVGLPALVVDFKRVFTLPYVELQRQLKGGAKRRTRLVSPYLEHFAVRLAAYNQRVGLPEPHRWPRGER